MPIRQVYTSQWKEFSTRGSRIVDSHVPIVLKGCADTWGCMSWTPGSFSEHYGEVEVEIKFERKQEGPPKWESECEYRMSSLREFCGWIDLGGGTSDGKVVDRRELADFKECDWSGYVDYKYFPQLFDDGDTAFGAVRWKDLGISADSKDSVFWMGSSGASTPLHYDSYGCNVVLQVYGKKEWILFPPEASTHLKPSRIPFEESSVYAKVGIPDSIEFTADPQKCPGDSLHTILEAGDVLFVPKHWWHQVRCLSTAISINVWTQHPSDEVDHLHEGISRFLLMASHTYHTLEGSHIPGSDQQPFRPNLPTPRCKWLNPNEQMLGSEQVLQSINYAISQMHSKNDSDLVDKAEEPVVIEDIVQAACHPRVVSLIAEILLENRKTQNI